MKRIKTKPGILTPIKIFNYRGWRVYVRHIKGNYFEFLAVFGSEARMELYDFSNMKKMSQAQIIDVTEMMSQDARNFIDYIIYERSFITKIKQFIQKYGKKDRAPSKVS